jgi:hypothetical protein
MVSQYVRGEGYGLFALPGGFFGAFQPLIEYG